MTSNPPTQLGDALAACLPTGWERVLDDWFREDTPAFDVGGFVVGGAHTTATLFCKSDGVLAGKPFFDAVFLKVHCTVTWYFEEGTILDTSSGKVRVASVQGAARHLLQGERIALNILARCSGIATRAKKFVALAASEGFRGRIAATRKTTPGFRLVEKYGVLAGGADTHRHDLSAMVMLKDNHCASVGSITAAVHKARQVAGFSVKIEVECGCEAHATEAIAAGADIVMLDNFEPAQLKEVARRLKCAAPHVLVEASGGITEETLARYLDDAVDVISFGCLTQGVPHVDFSLKVDALSQ